MEQIGRYQILDEVGRGAMGVVYRAQDPAIGRIIAVKTIRLTDLTDPDERERLRERLFREAQSAGILSHPNIVTIYDIAEENGKACIFMEYVNGPSLEKLMMSQQAPDKQTFLNIFRQTAAALDYAHRKGIVHRDIKPANIMIHEDGEAKITDFGVAKVISHQVTQSGGMMGTPNYMSPEQVQGLGVDGRADQFALAVIAYELLTGEKPFVGDYLPTLLYKIVRENPAPPERLNPTIGPQMEEVLERGLSKIPQDRFPSCTEFVGALVEAANATPGWTPLPRGSSQSMPTMAENGAPARTPEPRPAAPAGPPPRPLRRDEANEPNPLLKSLVWVMVGIGLVGLALLGAQKFLFNTPAASAPVEQAAAPEPAPKPQIPVKEKPSPAGEIQKQVEKKAAQAPGVLPGDAPKESAPPNDAAPKQTSEPPKRDTAQPPLPVTTPKTGPERTVQVLTDPAGAKVSVDGGASCTSPCMLSLPFGRHTVNTDLDGYRPYPRVFNIPDESDVFLKLVRSSGTLSVTSNPEGATIQINGEAKSQKTPAAFPLPPGNYKVRVTRDGVPLEFEVQVKDGEFQNRNVNFK